MDGMSLHAGARESVSPVKASHCQYCSQKLDILGYHFTCHVCGAEYCYPHMRRHDRAHPRSPVLVQSA